MQGAGDVSVEEILASIKRVIARDAVPPAPPAPSHVPLRPAAIDREPVEPADAEEAGEVLALAEDRSVQADAGLPPPPLTGTETAEASRAAFASLQALAGGTALDSSVQQLLRPMLADWLDAHLPAIVERLVRAEIARITGVQA